MPRSTLIALGLLLVVTLALPFYATRHDVGFAGDSGSYINAARTFAQNGQLLVPDGQGGEAAYSSWPPLYPWTLGFLSRIFGDALPAARWLDVVLFPINFLLLVAVARRLKLSPWATVFIGVLFIFAPAVMTAHVLAMSGALFITTWLANWLLILMYQAQPSWGLLAAAGALGALSALNRYVGLATAAAFGLYLFLCVRGSWFKKIAISAIYFALCLAPVACWLWSNRQSTSLVKLAQSSAGPASFYQSWIAPEVAAVARWVLPIDGHNAFKAVLALFLVVGVTVWIVAVFRGRSKVQTPPALSWAALARPEITILLNMVACQMILVGAKTFRDRSMVFDERQETQVFICLLLLAGVLATAGQAAFQAGAAKGVRCYLKTVLGVVLVGYLFTGAIWLWRADEVHLEWSSRPYRESRARELITHASANTPIYGNIVNPLYYYTGRTDLYRMPDAEMEINGQRNPKYTQQVEAMIADVAKRHALIVVFNTGTTRFASSEELKKNSQLRVALDTPEVTIFEASGG